jgi:hypothetical protein
VTALDGDELAGVVDQFGALTRAELRRAVEEVAFRAGDDVDGEAVAAAVDRAEDRLQVVAVDHEDEELLVAGPGALPALPAGAENLPHVMDVPERSVDRATVAEAAEARLRAGAARAVSAGDRDRVAALLDATYDLEAWAPDVDATGVRARLDDALAGLDGSA